MSPGSRRAASRTDSGLTASPARPAGRAGAGENKGRGGRNAELPKKSGKTDEPSRAAPAGRGSRLGAPRQPGVPGRQGRGGGRGPPAPAAPGGGRGRRPAGEAGGPEDMPGKAGGREGRGAGAKSSDRPVGGGGAGRPGRSRQARSTERGAGPEARRLLGRLGGPARPERALTPHLTASHLPFFEGLSPPRPAPAPLPPPGKGRGPLPPTLPTSGRRRCLSCSDVQAIGRAVQEGDRALLEAFYPDFPVSPAVYTVWERGGAGPGAGRPGEELVDSEMLKHRFVRSAPPHGAAPPPGPALAPGLVTPPGPAPSEAGAGGRGATIIAVRSPPGPRDHTSRGPGPQNPGPGPRDLGPGPRDPTKTFSQADLPCPTSAPASSPCEAVVRRRQSLDCCSSGDRSSGPWGRGGAGRGGSIIQVGSDNVVLVEVGEGEGPGPSITRVQGPGPPPARAHYSGILAAAGTDLTQAESLLSSLGHRARRAASPSDSEEEPASLGSDIETNIRRLERTQAKINAALETFRNVQNLRTEEEDDPIETDICHPPLCPEKRSTFPQSQAERAATEEIAGSGRPPAACSAEGPRGRRGAAVRRHSFNSAGRRQREPAGSLAERAVASWYQDSGQSSDSGVRTSDLCEEGFCSDSEGGLSPFKNRIRGLLGSFGKGRRKAKKPPQRRQLEESLSSGAEPPRADLSIGQFTELVQGLASSVTSEEGEREREPGAVVLRDRVTSQNCSNDTFSSLSTNITSNRNSVVSEQSMSSESFDNNSNSDVGNGNMTKANMHDLTPLQLQDRKIFFIAREIMTSEKAYVNVIRLVNIDFREFLQKARQEAKAKSILSDQDFAKLFSNLAELMILNEDLLQDFENRIRNWESQKKIADVIVKKGPYLKLYTVFIRDFSSMNLHFDECCQKYPKFAKLVKEFERQPKCGQLKLQHFLLKPVQRLPQYRLLLEDYLRHLHPDSPDFDDTTNALRIVSDAAEHANDTVKQGDKFQRMLALQARLGAWELVRPGRELLREGRLTKISRKGAAPRYFILLSDCLLYCEFQGPGTGDTSSLRISYTIELSQLHVHVPRAEDFQTEFSITSSVRSCTLRAADLKERNEWLEALHSAIEEFRSRRATFLPVDQLPGGPDSEERCVGDVAPVWIPDQRVTMCQSCSAEFGLVVRRHHCRACGRVVCGPCSSSRAPLRYRQFQSARVCDICFEAVEAAHGETEDLRARFKRRDTSRPAGRYVPQRLQQGANTEGSQMAGYLRRRLPGQRWKRAWFVLKERVLYSHRASEDAVATEALPVLGWTLDTAPAELEPGEGAREGLVFKLSHPGSGDIMFCAENMNIAARWTDVLAAAVTLEAE